MPVRGLMCWIFILLLAGWTTSDFAIKSDLKACVKSPDVYSSSDVCAKPNPTLLLIGFHQSIIHNHQEKSPVTPALSAQNVQEHCNEVNGSDPECRKKIREHEERCQATQKSAAAELVFLSSWMNDAAHTSEKVPTSGQLKADFFGYGPCVA